MGVPFPKKWIPVASFLTVAFVVWLFKPLLPVPVVSWEYPPQGQVGVAVAGSIPVAGTQEVVTQQDGIKAVVQDANSSSRTSAVAQATQGAEVEMITSEAERQKNLRVQVFGPGTPQPVGYSYTKTLVVPKTRDEDTAWIDENFGGSDTINSAVYTVDDLDSELHPPKNKGHEVMVYLSYIIDHYNNLSDVNIFMHSHRYAWHNNELLDLDAVQMVSRLSAERVQREGYMNMRCSWDPGCPSWMHPGTVEEDINKQEETMLAKSWSELFPLDPIPYTLAQPCCAQFAISRDRIRSLPLARYVYYRDWLLRTSLSDYISGRIWEYVWQFVFTGQNIVCPMEHVCLCDGFGVCFGGEEEFNHYAQKNQERIKLQEELDQWNKDNEVWTENEDLEPPEIGKDLEFKGRIDALQAWCDAKKQKAKEHGDVAMHRAKEAGRPWKDGDGF
ncbi:uncharacterized protein PAC_16082 [Phialocephala subalpina]|uniref:Uncharacterized protein n=1 Tax=Phialocephala subalpina TaxID=576137 RepID=A0A1L7XM95_9HELO|nr:uncharacterized protein PAC_16082 [Phialocephala subalpina]